MKCKRKDNEDTTFLKDIWKVREGIIKITFFEIHMEGKRTDNGTKTFMKDVWKVRERIRKVYTTIGISR